MTLKQSNRAIKDLSTEYTFVERCCIVLSFQIIRLTYMYYVGIDIGYQYDAWYSLL